MIGSRRCGREFPGGLCLGRSAFTVKRLGLIPGWETKILQAVKHSSPPNPEDVDDTYNGILLNYSAIKKEHNIASCHNMDGPKDITLSKVNQT